MEFYEIWCLCIGVCRKGQTVYTANVKMAKKEKNYANDRNIEYSVNSFHSFIIMKAIREKFLFLFLSQFDQHITEPRFFSN